MYGKSAMFLSRGRIYDSKKLLSSMRTSAEIDIEQILLEGQCDPGDLCSGSESITQERESLKSDLDS